MGNITDPGALAFVVGRIRPGADQLAMLYRDAKRTTQAWNALLLEQVITNTDDLIDIGDGRTIKGSQAVNIITRMNEFIADYEAGSSGKLNTVLQVAPNP